MTEKNQVYRCPICGNIVTVSHAGAGELVCCGKPMLLQSENTVDAATEKHVPVIEKIGENTFRVTVGEIEHPMEEDHYIEWIELQRGKETLRTYLAPGDKPQAEFTIQGEGEVIAREYCNLHGLWMAKM